MSFDAATVKAELDRRLKDWAVYARFANDPGLDISENLISRLMKKDSNDWKEGETLAPRDWTPEHEVDEAIRLLLMLTPITGVVIIVHYVHCPRKPIAKKLETLTRLMKQNEPEFPGVSERRFWGALDQGRFFIAGRLSLC